MNNRPITRSSSLAVDGGNGSFEEEYTIQTNNNHKRKAEDGLIDEQTPNKKLDSNSSTEKKSTFPRFVRPKSASKSEGSKPNVLKANVVITDQHLSLTRGLHSHPITSEPLLKFQKKHEAMLIDHLKELIKHSHPITSEPLLEFQKKHEAMLIDHLKELIKREQTLEIGLEMASLVNLLKLFNYPHDSEKQNFVNHASAGAQRLQDGLVQVKEGQDLLLNAIQMLHPKKV